MVGLGRVIGFLLAVLAATVGAATGARAAVVLVLDVVLNGRDTGQVGSFLLAGGRVSATASQIRAMGILADCGSGRCDLSTIAGLRWRIDAHTQTIVLTAPSRLLATQRIQADATAQRYPVTNGTGAVFTYDLNSIRSGGQTLSSGLLTLHGFSADSAITADSLVQMGPRGSLDGNALVRLDTTYVYSAPSKLRQVSLGDFVGSGLAWSRPVRLTGVQIASNFGLQPGLITYPLPSVSGSVAVPSTIDVLVDQTRMLTHALQPGPFEVAQIPVMTGAGQISIATTDALGRHTVTTTNFYASPDLLRPGLTSYALELGALRLNWGSISNDYGPLVGSATLRRGIAPDITIETHGETTRGLLMAGGGAVIDVANAGVVGFDVAGSSLDGRAGFDLALDARHDGRQWTLGASATIAGPRFADIAAANGQSYPQRQVSAIVGRRLGRFGSLGIGYAQIDTPHYRSVRGADAFGTIAGSEPITAAIHAQIVTVSYSAQAFGTAVYATGYHDFAQRGDSGVMFGIAIPLSARRSSGAQLGVANGSGYGAVQAQQTADRTGEFGYQLDQSVGVAGSGFASGQYQSGVGNFSAGIGRSDGALITQARASGSVALLDRQVFLSPPVNDSFAVVDTSGVAGVRVMDENRLVGRTDGAGRLLVPGLTAFTANRLSIDPLDVPLNVTVPFTEATVVPGEHAGVVVRFPLERSRAALVTVLDSRGQPVPLGSTARLAGNAFPVGHGGVMYLTHLRPTNRLTIVTPDGAHCRVRFAYRDLAVPLQTIGPLRCVGF